MQFHALAELTDDPDRFIAVPPRTPQVWSAAPDSVCELYDLDQLDDLVVHGGLTAAALTVAKFSRRAPEAQYTMRRHSVEPAVADLCDPLAVAQFLHEGYSLHASNLQRYSKQVLAFSDRLAFELGTPVKADAFMTPPGAQAFAEHYDTHDSFICQMAGRKAWRLYSSPFASPLTRHPWSWTDVSDELRARIVDEPPDVEVVLEPGSVLWIPRGWIHAGTAASETSLHVTLRTEHISIEWVAQRLVEYVADEHRDVRRGVPYGSYTTPGRARDQLHGVTSLLRDLLAEVDVEAAATQLWNAHSALFAGPAMRPVRDVAVGHEISLDELWFRPEGAVGHRRHGDALQVNLGTARKVLGGVQASLLEGILVNGEYARVDRLGAKFDSVVDWPKFVAELRATGLVVRESDLIRRWLPA